MDTKDESNRSLTIIVVAAVMEAIAVTCVTLRLWSLQVTKRKLLPNDVFLLFGFILSTALVTVIICAVEYGGLGQHAFNLMATPWKLLEFGKLLLAAQALWGLTMTAIRLSIVGLYAHIFSSRPRFIKVCYGMMAVCMLWCLAYLLTVFLNCRPLAYVWDKSDPNGRCGDLNKAYLGTQVSNLILDFIVTLLPIPVLWGLRMPMWRKVSIALMFGLGFIICAISVARISHYQLALQYDQDDFTYTGATLWIFTVLEPLLSCSLACMPLLRPLVDKFASSPAVSKCKSVTSRLRWTKAGTYAPGEVSNDTENLRTIETIGGGRHGWDKLSDGRKGSRGRADSEASYEMTRVSV